MNTPTRNTALALIATLTLVLAGTATAAPPRVRLLPPTPTLPQFGFSSFNIAGYGERVTRVRWDGLAAQFGLEPGDTILRLNGYPLTYYGAWDDALSRAAADGGWIQLMIRDVRTGAIAYRQIALGTAGYGPYGPITPKVHITGHPYLPPQNMGPGGRPHHPDGHKPPHGGQAPLLWEVARLLDND
jgi:membrane-associated protease RseP (regulator of RpoE activity)